VARRGAGADLAAIKAGQTVRVTPAGGERRRRRVRMVAPTVDPATRNGLVYVDLPRPARRQGRHVRARRVRARHAAAAMTLPQGAVLLRDGFSYVFQVGADNKVRQLKVSVGRRSR
jgi:HlyD family secretion protein